MAVTVIVRATGETAAGKFAVIDKGIVSLYTGVAARKHGGYRGCGRKRVFHEPDVTVAADEAAWEIEDLDRDRLHVSTSGE